MYFANFPNIYYEYTINGVTHLKIVKDITANIRFIKEVVENITSYDEYDILDGETPEQIAANVYGNSLYHWVIMIVNDRYDYREDFPLDYTALNKRVDAIYGDQAQAIHHWEYVAENGKTYIVNQTQSGATSVSNFAYEERLNESKRRIKLISRPQLDAVLKQFETIFD